MSGEQQRENTSQNEEGRAPSEKEKTAVRVAWQSSPERKRLQRVAIYIAGIGAAVTASSGIIAFLYDRFDYLASCSNYSYNGASENTCGARAMRSAFEFSFYTLPVAALIAFGIGFYTYIFYRMSLRREMRDRQIHDAAQRQLTAAEEAVYGGTVDAAALELSPLWNATHERLNLYHRIATQQAQDSFRRAQAAMVIGFSMVGMSILIALVASSAAGSIVAGILGAVAAALSGFISHTFIRSQESAAQHLRAYFLQPLEFSRYLVAERLLDTLDDQQKAEGILAIVQGIAQFSAIGGDSKTVGDAGGQGRDA